MRGRGGADVICDNDGDDRVDGGAGDDIIGGGRGADRLAGGAGDDWLAGRRGADLILGGRGDDRLVGELGDDVLRGNSGDDRIGGGPGADDCDGGAGSDLVSLCETGDPSSDLPTPTPPAPPGPTPPAPPGTPPVDLPPVAVGDSATVTEDGGPADVAVLANDTDVDGGPKSIVSVTQPSNGTVQITGGGTGLTYEPDADYCNDPLGTPTDNFTYTLAPGGSSASVATTVTCVNDAPLVATSAGSAAYTENAPASPVDPDLLVVDSDSLFASGATVLISGNFTPGDELAFADQAGISGSYDSATGVLTLTGAALVSDYQIALRSVGFRHIGDDPAAARTVSFSVTDGAAASTPAVKGIQRRSPG